MREVKEHTIDGITYRIQQLGAKQGRLVLARVIRAVGSAAESDEPVAKFASALTDAEVDFLCDTFAKTTRYTDGDGKAEFVLADQFDNHFAGRYGAMTRWLWAAFQTNYSSFLAELGFTPEGLQEALKKATGSIQSAPTPPSGASSSPASVAS